MNRLSRVAQLRGQTPRTVAVHTSKVITLPMESVITLLWNPQVGSSFSSCRFASKAGGMLPATNNTPCCLCPLLLPGALSHRKICSHLMTLVSDMKGGKE